MSDSPATDPSAVSVLQYYGDLGGLEPGLLDAHGVLLPAGGDSALAN